MAAEIDPTTEAAELLDLAKALGRAEVFEWVIDRCVSIGLRAALEGDEKTQASFTKFAEHLLRVSQKEHEATEAKVVSVLFGDGVVN